MPTVWVHRIIVHFEGGTSRAFFADDIATLAVVERKLHVAANPTPPMMELLAGLDRDALVTEVEFEYRAADFQEYRTVVRAGVIDDPDAADHIRFRPEHAPDVFPIPPEVIPARDIRAGRTFAVVRHDGLPLSAMSEALEAGWHRSDCTWFYPY